METISLLTKARICHLVYHSHCGGVPLGAEQSDKTYKLLFLNIGLLNNIRGIDWQTLSGYEGHQLVNEGGLAEQFVGTHLLDRAHGLEPPRLYYWLRKRKSANAELDYVINFGPRVIPVEVKSGKSGSLKSLQQFIHENGAALGVRFDLNLPSFQAITHTIRTAEGNTPVSYKLLSLPLYAVEELDRLLRDL